MNTWPKKNLMTMTSEVKMLLRLRPDQKALVLHPWCWELRLMSALSELDEDFCLMATSPYGCFDWILQCKILTPSYDA